MDQFESAATGIASFLVTLDFSARATIPKTGKPVEAIGETRL
jgi:hypothetical protein